MSSTETPSQRRDREARRIEEAEQRQTEARISTVAFIVAMFAGIGAAVAYWNGWTTVVLGVALSITLLGIGIGLIAWAKSLDVDEDAVQEREPLCLNPTDEAALNHTLTVADRQLERRPLLGGLLLGAIGSLVVAMVGPLGSLGPKPRGELKSTAWKANRQLVTVDGHPIKAAGAPFDQLVSAFPKGFIGRDDSQIVVMRLDPELLTERAIQGGAVDGWVAYSKICTHAGCSVGLLGVDSRPPNTLRQLVCPCHQSVFDPVDSAHPIGGPAPRPLPQLPLAVDSDGFLIATADFPRPVGPITWTEG